MLIFFFLLRESGRTPSVSLAVAGIVIGEFASALYSARMFSGTGGNRGYFSADLFGKSFRELIPLSLPLTANRAVVTLLQSIEAVSIPACLRAYGHGTGDTLIIYGVLTGMALPCILFPSAVTNSVGVMLMPAVAEKQASGNRTGMMHLIRRAAGGCFLLGMACCLFFLIFGTFIGNILFHSDTAGKFIVTLAWICPFLYTNSALISTINGLGKTLFTFLINTSGLAIRIASVFLVIPHFGIQGYLWGLLLSQFIVSGMAVWILWIISGRIPATDT